MHFDFLPALLINSNLVSQFTWTLSTSEKSLFPRIARAKLPPFLVKERSINFVDSSCVPSLNRELEKVLRFAEGFLPFCFRRRSEQTMSLKRKEIFEFGEFRLDVDEHTIERIDGHKNGTLTEKAFQALVLLVRRRGHLVSKDELIGFVWPDTIVEDNNLEKCIHHLRQFLGETSGRKQIHRDRKKARLPLRGRC